MYDVTMKYNVGNWARPSELKSDMFDNGAVVLNIKLPPATAKLNKPCIFSKIDISTFIKWNFQLKYRCSFFSIRFSQKSLCVEREGWRYTIYTILSVWTAFRVRRHFSGFMFILFPRVNDRHTLTLLVIVFVRCKCGGGRKQSLPGCVNIRMYLIFLILSSWLFVWKCCWQNLRSGDQRKGNLAVVHLEVLPPGVSSHHRQPPSVSWHRQLAPAPPSAGGQHQHQLTCRCWCPAKVSAPNFFVSCIKVSAEPWESSISWGF